MTKKILIIQGHPDPEGSHLCHALAEAYKQGAVESGHVVKDCFVAKLNFPLIHSQTEWREGHGPDDIKSAQEDLLWADHIVIIYPLWLGTMPALLKGFFEQILREGIAFEKGEGGQWKARLKGKSARVVITMGMPAFVYRWYFGAHSLKSLERNILKFTGIKPVHETLIGMVDALDDTKTQKVLTKLRDLGQMGA